MFSFDFKIEMVHHASNEMTKRRFSTEWEEKSKAILINYTFA